MIYLDDIAVFRKNFTENMEHLRKLLTLLANYGLKLKLNKGNFFAERTDYLGHIIRSSKKYGAGHTTDAIGRMDYPTAITELKSFLGP